MLISEAIDAITKNQFEVAQKMLAEHQQAIAEQKINLNEIVSMGEHAGHLLMPLALSTLIELYKKKDQYFQEDFLARFKTCRALFDYLLFLGSLLDFSKINAQGKSTFSVCLESFSEVKNIVEENKEHAGAWLFLLIPLLDNLKNNNNDFQEVEKLVRSLLNQRNNLKLKDIHEVTPFRELMAQDLWGLVAETLDFVKQDENFIIPEVSTVNPATGNTLLHVVLAAFVRLKQKNGDLKDIETAKKLIQWLINQGADLNAKNTDGVTPFGGLVGCGLWELVAAVLNHVEQDENFKIAIDTGVSRYKKYLTAYSIAGIC